MNGPWTKTLNVGELLYFNFPYQDFFRFVVPYRSPTFHHLRYHGDKQWDFYSLGTLNECEIENDRMTDVIYLYLSGGCWQNKKVLRFCRATKFHLSDL